MEKVRQTGIRLSNFFKEVWNEVSPWGGKVVWPSQHEIINSTVVVLGLLIVLTIFVVGLNEVGKLVFQHWLGLYPTTPTK